MKRQRFAIAAAILLTAGCYKNRVTAPGPQPPATSEEFVQVLVEAYRTQDYATFSLLLADDFLYILDERNPDGGETQWDALTERRIHSRMFDPQNIPTTDPQLSPDVWLQAVSITLTPLAAFDERFDLYTTAMPPGPLDPTRWIARHAIYGADVFFQLQGDTDYQARGRAAFTVLEDRAKQVGDAGKFLILRWEDLGQYHLAGQPSSWSALKGLYR